MWQKFETRGKYAVKNRFTVCSLYAVIEQKRNLNQITVFDGRKVSSNISEKWRQIVCGCKLPQTPHPRNPRPPGWCWHQGSLRRWGGWGGLSLPRLVVRLYADDSSQWPWLYVWGCCLAIRKICGRCILVSRVFTRILKYLYVEMLVSRRSTVTANIVI